MTLEHIPFDDSYRPAYRQVSRAVRGGDVIFTCGQLDADGRGQVQHVGDLRVQTERSLALLRDVIAQAGGTFADMLELQVFYRDHEGLDEAAYAATLDRLMPVEPRPVIVLTPLASFPKGCEVEVDAIAVAGSSARRIAATAASKRAFAVRHRDLVIAQTSTSSQGAGPRTRASMLLEDLVECLAQVGARLADVCKVRYYPAGGGRVIDEVEQLIAERFAEVRPVYTRLPLVDSPWREPRYRLEVIALCADEGAPPPRRRVLRDEHWKWPWPSLPYAHAIGSGRFLFVGGQLPVDREGAVVHAGDMAAQIPLVMRHVAAALHASGAGFDQVAKVNAFHAGHADLPTWTRNVQARCDFYPVPGPASTGVEVTNIGLEGALVAVDCIALLPVG